MTLFLSFLDGGNPVVAKHVELLMIAFHGFGRLNQTANVKLQPFNLKAQFSNWVFWRLTK